MLRHVFDPLIFFIPPYDEGYLDKGIGSPSVSYFIGIFRKTYGLSPNRFRKAISIS